MRTGKISSLVLTMAIALLGPLSVLAQTQSEPAPAQVVEEEGQSPSAAILTAINIPARGSLCLLASFMGGLVMVISGGLRYADAAQMMEEGCSGPWVITDKMIDEGLRRQKNASGTVTPGSEQPGKSKEISVSN